MTHDYFIIDNNEKVAENLKKGMRNFAAARTTRQERFYDSFGQLIPAKSLLIQRNLSALKSIGVE